MLLNQREKLASILQTTAENLDIPDSVYEDAVLKYEDVGLHLAAEGSDLSAYSPQIYPQGSFRLGTVVHPYTSNDEYDIDLVCQLAIPKEGISQKDLKSKVGLRLKAREDLAKIAEPSRRCWTLSYPVAASMPGFHMDVLPSIPNIENQPNGILLTDTELTRWQKSNPIEYAKWFKDKMAVVFNVRRAALANSMQASIEEVPEWRVKTSLQRAVQILKRHRDIYFQAKPDLRPVSIIITTLAAHAYRNQEDVFDALTDIVKRMPNYIENRSGRWWVQNPVDDGENFADKWNDYPDRKDAFMAWMIKVETDFSAVSRSDTLANGLTALDESMGRDMMNKVAAKLGVTRPGIGAMTVYSKNSDVPALASAAHALPLSWSEHLQYRVTVSAGVYFKHGEKRGKFLWSLRDGTVPKNVWIKFSAKTQVPEPYAIKWQVVNTGAEAKEQLRGEFCDSESSDKNVRWESTAFRGTHWVEAFVIKNEVCVGRSGKFFVRIR